jgi:murein DD-endopeptidase MepM/ murein hydrolase activator NlpD
MESMIRWFVFILIMAGAVVGGSYYAAGQTTPAALSIDLPTGPVGQTGTLQVTAQVPRALFAKLEATLEQNGKTFPLFALADAEQGTITGASAKRADIDHLIITRQIGKAAIPELRQGTARLTVRAARTSFLRIRDVYTTVSKDIEVRLEPPRIAVLSTKHYLNHGGSEFVVYRATPPDVDSGVRVGDIEYRGFPASGAGVSGADASLKVAFFALLHDQPLHSPVAAFARDAAGNEATASFIDDVFEKPFRKSRIAIDDRFLGRVVPEILAHSPQAKVRRSIDNPNDLLADFLIVNGDVRRANAEQIAELTRPSAADLLWRGPFIQLGNSQVEAAFADARTYVYNGKDVDQQTHLGFDLAVTARVPVLAANSGKVVNADWLGIYGNCVIIDHGLGVASLYGHLSSIDVKVGDAVTKGQVLGRSGMTGLAGGDHLHFTMLVGGHPVTPVEWWDPHWVKDRVERKLAEAAAAGAPVSR